VRLKFEISTKKLVMLWNRPWQNPLPPNKMAACPTTITMLLGRTSPIGPIPCTYPVFLAIDAIHLSILFSRVISPGYVMHQAVFLTLG